VETPERKMNDIGTRYQHLKELSEYWEICMEIIKKKGYFLSKDNKERLAKMLIAYEVLNITIDSLSDYNDIDVQYELGRSVRLIGKAEDVKGGRGTPLCNSF